MNNALLLLIALLLDAALGEPRWLWNRFPHPAVLMGRLITFFDQRFNTGPNRRAKGLLTLISISATAFIIGWLLSELGWVVEAIAAAILLAHRSLVDHVQAVADGLCQSLAEGRQAVAMIVGRDVTQMETGDVSRAAIESAAENFSDGVIAPAFWFLIGGLPGLVLYKMTNTADSMIGYKNEKYEEFGWAAARFDDLLNLIPARLSALLFTAIGGALADWSAIRADARQHRSPNAGWPEAALSRTLGVALAGPRSYDGTLRHFPFVNDTGLKEIGSTEIERAISMLWKTWATFLSIVAIGGLLSVVA